MNVLDSPLEVLTFNLVNLTPLFNNLWAFLAVITAAMFSFRHFRASVRPVSKTLHETVLHKVNDNVTTRVVVTQEDEKDEDEDVEEVVLSRGNSKKFFRVYYEEEGEKKEGCVDDDVDGVDEELEVENEVVIEKWTVEMRGGEFGWYEFQDRSVIDGSVVKLWECEREKSNSPRKRLNKSCSFGVITPFGLLGQP